MIMKHVTIGRLAILGAAVIGLAMCSAASIAQDAPAADPDFEAAKAAFEALPIENRVLIQRNLVWAVPFNGAALGTFGKLTYAGIKAFEKRAATEVNGILTPEEMDQLAKQAAAAQKSAKFQIVADKKSGTRIGLPLSLLTRQEATAIGAKWSNADASISVETAKGTGTAADLSAAFDRFLALPDRKVTYKLLKPDFFVITGENGADSFYVRYSANDTAMRGFTFRYPTAKQKLMDRYVIAAANTFEPFPGAAPGADVAQGSTEAPPAAPTSRLSTAIRLADGSVLASAKAASGCKSITLSGKAAKSAAGPTDLVTLSGGVGTSALAARATAPAAGEAILALASDKDGAMTVAPGSLITVAGKILVEAALQPSAAGAAIVDRQGQLIGIVTGDPAAVKPIAGVTPVSRFTMAVVPGAANETGAPKSAGAIAAMLKSAALPLSCAL
jgi:hypothetical protein